MDYIYEKYIVLPNHITPDNGRVFETYGSDIKYIERQLRKDRLFPKPRNIWTLIDRETANDDDTMVAVAGARCANRVGYITTKEEWRDKNERYIWLTCERR
jgi:hypothetical protein